MDQRDKPIDGRQQGQFAHWQPDCAKEYAVRQISRQLRASSSLYLGLWGGLAKLAAGLAVQRHHLAD